MSRLDNSIETAILAKLEIEMEKNTGMNFPNIQRLSEGFRRPLVIVDIEHTGSAGEKRGIVEIACLVVTPEMARIGIDTLVNPGAGVCFNPVASRITGIDEDTVAFSGPWHELAAGFVLAHQESIWVGYHSNATDLPIIKAEHERLGLPLPDFKHKLDVRKAIHAARGISGSLGEMVELIIPGAKTQGHRAMADVMMTAALLEAIADEVPHRFFKDCGLFSGKASRPTGQSRPAKAVEATKAEKPPRPVDPNRPAKAGKPWDEQDLALLTERFYAEDSIPEIAKTLERTAFAVALKLATAGLMTHEEAEAYKPQPVQAPA